MKGPLRAFRQTALFFFKFVCVLLFEYDRISSLGNILTTSFLGYLGFWLWFELAISLCRALPLSGQSPPQVRVLSPSFLCAVNVCLRFVRKMTPPAWVCRLCFVGGTKNGHVAAEGVVSVVCCLRVLNGLNIPGQLGGLGSLANI